VQVHAGLKVRKVEGGKHASEPVVADVSNVTGVLVQLGNVLQHSFQRIERCMMRIAQHGLVKDIACVKTSFCPAPLQTQLDRH
jgi:hypothetical protein